MLCDKESQKIHQSKLLFSLPLLLSFGFQPNSIWLIKLNHKFTTIKRNKEDIPTSFDCMFLLPELAIDELFLKIQRWKKICFKKRGAENQFESYDQKISIWKRKNKKAESVAMITIDMAVNHCYLKEEKLTGITISKKLSFAVSTEIMKQFWTL